MTIYVMVSRNKKNGGNDSLVCRPLCRSRIQLRMSKPFTLGLLACFLVSWSVSVAPRVAHACPFCESVRQTLTEQIDAADTAVIALPMVNSSGGQEMIGTRAAFRVVRVLDGADHIGDVRTIPVVYYGDADPNLKFLVLGNLVPELMWGGVVPLTDESFGYLNKQLELPRDSHERVALAIQYLTSKEKVLAQDAYDEFARAPYDHLHKIKDVLDPDDLIAHIKDEEVPWERRRLYLTLLGVCGQEKHLAEIEKLLEQHDKKRMRALDALAACYMTLLGVDALPLLEERFLQTEEVDRMVRASAVISALRFHGERDKEVPRQAIVEVMQRMLNRPQLAGKVLVDLTRWKDWSIVEQVAQLYHAASGESAWVSAPAIRYLETCPLPEAKEHLAAILEKDPHALRRARPFFPPEKKSTTASTLAKEKGSPTKAVENADPAAGSQLAQASDEKAASSQEEGGSRSKSLQPGTGSQVEPGRGQPVPTAKESNRFMRVAWVAIFPVAGACLLVLLFWVRKKGDSAEDVEPSSPATE